MLAGKRVDARREPVSSDLTAIITGPFAWTFDAAEPQSANQTYPESQHPFREFAIHYHDDFMEAFVAFRFGDMEIERRSNPTSLSRNNGAGCVEHHPHPGC
jgi:hypothetical protein